MEQPPYIQHSLVISKLPYLPPPEYARMRIAPRTHPRARLCAPPPCRVSCARSSPPGWVRAKSRSLASASRKSRTRLYSYTAIPCLTRSSRTSSSSSIQPSRFRLYINGGDIRIIPSAILTDHASSQTLQKF